MSAVIEIIDNFFTHAFYTAAVYVVLTDWHQAIFPLKVASAIVSILLIALIAYLLFKIRKSIKNAVHDAAESMSDSGAGKVANEQWQRVLDKIEKGEPDNYKLAIIEADKIFDEALKNAGYRGEDMGDRLKQASTAQIPNINDIWEAHKLRNRLAHESGFQLTYVQAKQAISAYQKALEILGTIKTSKGL